MIKYRKRSYRGYDIFIGVPIAKREYRKVSYRGHDIFIRMITDNSEISFTNRGGIFKKMEINNVVVTYMNKEFISIPTDPLNVYHYVKYININRKTYYNALKKAIKNGNF